MGRNWGNWGSKVGNFRVKSLCFIGERDSFLRNAPTVSESETGRAKVRKIKNNWPEVRICSQYAPIN
jgi:hypothetical protein